MASTSDLSRGAFIKYNNELMQVIEYEHRAPGKGAAFYQVKMRNIKTGKLAENRFRAGETIIFVRVETHELMYSYKDANSLVCMDNETFEQTFVDEQLFGDKIKYLKEGVNIKVSFDEDNNPIMVELPTNVVLEVTYTEPGIKGDTATKTLKPATLETGAEISIPLFVDTGEMIKVNTDTGEYVERVK